MPLYLSRDTKVYLKQGGTGQVFEIPVLDGFSFSQSTNTSEITVSESKKSASSSKSRRSRRVYNDSYAPAEWSFSTYARPIESVATGDSNTWNQGTHASKKAHAIEEALWANFVAGSQAFTDATADETGTFSKGITSTATTMTVDFTESEQAEVGTFDLYFVLGKTGAKKVYKLVNCVINEASFDFDIDGIATINWSGMSSKIVDNETTSFTGTEIKEKLTDTNNYIRNRLTTLSITAKDTDKFEGASTNGVYNVILTGGSISFSNNITYLTPSTLGKVDRPLGHVTGARNISGSFTCYLDNDTGDIDELFKELITHDQVAVNEFSLVFGVGGASTPNVTVTLPHCHLEIPSHNIEDVISMEVNFHALTEDLSPSSASAFEATIAYNPVTTS